MTRVLLVLTSIMVLSLWQRLERIACVVYSFFLRARPVSFTSRGACFFFHVSCLYVYLRPLRESASPPLPPSIYCRRENRYGSMHTLNSGVYLGLGLGIYRGVPRPPPPARQIRPRAVQQRGERLRPKSHRLDSNHLSEAFSKKPTAAAAVQQRGERLCRTSQKGSSRTISPEAFDRKLIVRCWSRC